MAEFGKVLINLHCRLFSSQRKIVSDKGDKFGIGGVLDVFFWISYTDFGSNPIVNSIRSRTGIDPAGVAEPAVLTVEVGST